MAKEQRVIDIELLRNLVKNPDMVARILNPIGRRFKTSNDKLLDSQLVEFYRVNLLHDIKSWGNYRGFGSLSTKTLENYLLSKDLIDIPGYFAYLPILKHEILKEDKNMGMAELVKDGSRTLVYPIGIFIPNGPTLHFGRSLDDVTELVFNLGKVNIKDIEKFRRLHSQISDSYDSKDYIFRKTAKQ